MGKDKPSILIYTGHDELIGGDVHYTFDLLNQLVESGFDVKVLTDINKLFDVRANAWLNVEVDTEYLDTRPKLFTPHPVEKYYDTLNSKQEDGSITSTENIIWKLLSIKVGPGQLHWYLKVLCRIAVFKYLREHLHNYSLFKRVLKQHAKDFDIFHFNNGGFPAKTSGIWALLSAKKLGFKKIVMTVHNIARKRTFILDPIYDRIATRSCDQIITASDRVKGALTGNRKIPLDKCMTIRCGLENIEPITAEQALEKRQELDLGADQPVLLITGNYEEERKGHLPLIKAVALIKKEFPDILLLVVGSGSEERKLFLEQQIESLQIKDNVRFLGYRKDILELNCVANVCLTPSTGDESIPYTIIEAARMATPVITTTMGGCAEAVDSGKTGFVLEPNDHEQIAEKVVFLLKDKEACKQFGQNGRDLFLSKFLLKDRIQEHIDKVYKI